MEEKLIDIDFVDKDELNKATDKAHIEDSVLLELQMHSRYLNKLCLHLETVSSVLGADADFKAFHNQISQIAINTDKTISKIETRQGKRNKSQGQAFLQKQGTIYLYHEQ